MRRDGTVEVRAPLRMPQAEIARFLQEKESWIREKSALMRESARQRELFTLQPGTKIPFLGGEYPLRLGERAGFSGGGFVVLSGSQEEMRRQIEEVFHDLAAGFLAERVRRLAAQMDVMPAQIKITGAKTRWGSCSSKGSVCFSWRLMAAPAAAVEYVVAHELAHLKHMNHSAAFWSEVERVFPDYRTRRALLREAAPILF